MDCYSSRNKIPPCIIISTNQFTVEIGVVCLNFLIPTLKGPVLIYQAMRAQKIMQEEHEMVRRVNNLKFIAIKK